MALVLSQFVPFEKAGTFFFRMMRGCVGLKRLKYDAYPKKSKGFIKICIKKGEKYGCPTNFNKLTPAWYLNHSVNPNVATDNNYRFYALRNIKKGEELTPITDVFGILNLKDE